MPWLYRSANTIYPFIYLPPKIYEDLENANPSPHPEATLKHEMVHLERQKEMGLLQYGLKYFLSRKFRYQEELLATESQMSHLKSLGVTFDVDNRARLLSSSEYIWCVSYVQAKKDISEIWDRI